MNPSPFAGLSLGQVAIMVRDIEEAKARYARLLGIPAGETIITQPGDSINLEFRGAPSRAQAKLAFFQLPNLQLELIEPMGGESTWQEAFDQRGEHVHHIAFWVEGMSRYVTFLAGENVPLMQRGDMGEGQFAYFDSQAAFGCVIELLEKKRESDPTGA